MKFSLRFTCAAALAILATAMVGCQKETGSRAGLVPASGTVLYKGEPVADAVIEMRPALETMENCVAVARTDDQGKFAMMTDRPGDGAMPGTYKTVVKKQTEMIDGMTREEYEQKAKADGKEEVYFDKDKLVTQDLLPAKYGDPLNTPLEIEIPAKGDKKIEIVLED